MRALLRFPSRGALSLRTVLLLPALVAGVYATGLSLYLTRGVGAAAAALEAARVVVYHLGDLTGRAVALERALNVARELVTRPPPPDPGALRSLERLAADIATPAPAESFATVSDTVRRELVRSGEDLAALRSALTDVAALVAAGRRPAALARLHAADSLHD